jgi:hypothetical protein
MFTIDICPTNRNVQIPSLCLDDEPMYIRVLEDTYIVNEALSSRCSSPRYSASIFHKHHSFQLQFFPFIVHSYFSLLAANQAVFFLVIRESKVRLYSPMIASLALRSCATKRGTHSMYSSQGGYECIKHLRMSCGLKTSPLTTIQSSSRPNIPPPPRTSLLALAC